MLRNNLAYALALSGNTDEAEQWLDGVDLGMCSSEEKVHVIATRGLIALKRGQLQDGRRLYEEALAIAATPELRERVKAKRDLEIARVLLSDPGTKAEAVRLLRRAAAGGAGAEPYSLHASQELRQLGQGEAGPPHDAGRSDS
jgi:hypothetical protein